jgi:hypothetical protein
MSAKWKRYRAVEEMAEQVECIKQFYELSDNETANAIDEVKTSYEHEAE